MTQLNLLNELRYFTTIPVHFISLWVFFFRFFFKCNFNMLLEIVFTVVQCFGIISWKYNDGTKNVLFLYHSPLPSPPKKFFFIKHCFLHPYISKFQIRIMETKYMFFLMLVLCSIVTSIRYYNICTYQSCGSTYPLSCCCEHSYFPV